MYSGLRSTWNRTQSYQILLGDNVIGSRGQKDQSLQNKMKMVKVQSLSKQALSVKQRMLISNISKIFIKQMNPKPTKIFVKLNQLPQPNIRQRDQCRINSIQISTTPYQQDKQKVFFQARPSGDHFSFGPALGQYQQDKDKLEINSADLSLVHIEHNHSSIIEETSEDRSKPLQVSQRSKLLQGSQRYSSNQRSNLITRGISFQISQQVGIGYVPKRKYNRDSGIHFPSSKSQTLPSDQPPKLSHKLTTTIYPQQQQKDFTCLISLDIFSRQKQLRQKLQQSQQNMQKLLQRDYLQMQSKKNEELISCRLDISHLNMLLKQKSQQNEQLNERTVKLNKQLLLNKQKIGQLIKMYEDKVKNQKQLEKKVKELQFSIKQIRQELVFKDNSIRQLKMQSIKEQQVPNDKSSTKTVPFKLDINQISHAISRAVSDRTLGVNGINGINSLNNLNSPSNQMMKTDGFPIIVVNQLPPQSPKEHSMVHPQVLSPHKSSTRNRMNIHKNIQSPQSTPNISIVRSSKSSQHFLDESGLRSRDSRRDHSVYSGFSAVHKIGFMKKNQKNEQGTLLDFMQGQQKPKIRKEEKKEFKVSCLSKNKK